LITTAHSLTGIDFSTSNLMYGQRPIRIRIYRHTGREEIYDLYENEKPQYISPVIDSTYYDIGAFQIPTGMESGFSFNLDSLEFADLKVGDEVLYYGYQPDESGKVRKGRKYTGKVIDHVFKNKNVAVAEMNSEDGCYGSAVFKVTPDGPELIGVLSGGDVEDNIVFIEPLGKGLKKLSLIPSK
jgi:hypothetical protein